MSGWFEPNEQIRDVLWHVSSTTGITAWTWFVFQDGELRGDVTAVITEIGSGFYTVSFTPDGPGRWACMGYETADPAVHYGDTYLVESITEKIGGQNFDVRKHGLTAVRSAVQTVADDQLEGSNSLNRMVSNGRR